MVVECVMTFMNMGCRVSLCEFDSIFLEKSWIWLNDPYINYYSAIGLISRQEKLESFNSVRERSDYMIWGVKYQDTPIGACGLKNIENKQAEYWGYIGERALHGKGLGYEMLTLVLAKAKEMCFSQVVLKVLLDNQRAIRLYQKCFFDEFNRDNNYVYMKRVL